MTTGEAKRILELVQAITEEALERGEEIRLSGFGIFRITDRAARTAHNPVTGETVKDQSQLSTTKLAGLCLPCSEPVAMCRTRTAPVDHDRRCFTVAADRVS